MKRSKAGSKKAKAAKKTGSKKAASSKKAAAGRDRRRNKRWKVAVLVRCAIPKLGEEVFDLEMWAKDVNENGLQLEWSRGLNVSHVGRDGDSGKSQHIRFDDVDFQAGSILKVQDLFYDDEGSPFIEGKITWAKQLPNGNWSLGIQFTDAKKQPEALLGAFKDFLSIVKNPTAAIAKASRRK